MEKAESPNERSDEVHEMNTKEMTVWIVGILCLFMALLSPVACTVQRQWTVAQAIKNGADPIAAKCALESNTAYEPMCIIRASSGAK